MINKELVLPALRGCFGDWVYYSCLMRLGDLASLVNFAEELHKDRRLSQWIQRSLEETRGKEISRYLTTQPQRFFNSLVVAVYGGDPVWYEAGDVRPATGHVDLPELPEATRFSIGFLRLCGKEKLFAVDGQHRLAGIRLAIVQENSIADDDASILLVAHKHHKAGMERTRRLFTTLNKTPRHVSKRDIIALDEDDVMAICVRQLVESHPFFMGERIALNQTSNLRRDDQKSLTSIVTLYDVLLTLFRDHPRRVKTKDLKFNRPEQPELDEYYALAVSFFESLASKFPSLKDYMRAKAFNRLVAKLRGPFGGHILFRPIGILLFARLASRLLHHTDMEGATDTLALLPTELDQSPYVGVLWSESQQRMLTDNAPLTERLLAYMLGASYDKKKLLREYAKTLDKPLKDVGLPTPVSDAFARPKTAKSK
jgi:DNA sulfur modification protein DndB